jgi:hypothetical protein
MSEFTLAARTELKLKINRFLSEGKRGTRRIEELERKFENVRADHLQMTLAEMVKEKTVMQRGSLFFRYNQFGRPCTPQEISTMVRELVG